MIRMIKNCALVLTDSGGLQKEAYFFNKYCITMRDQTEWVELVKHGFNELVGADSALLLAGFKRFINKEFNRSVELYGGGNASKKVAHIINTFLASYEN
jgi:UDP-GlcNAc3NAcA epimerase